MGDFSQFNRRLRGEYANFEAPTPTHYGVCHERVGRDALIAPQKTAG